MKPVGFFMIISFLLFSSLAFSLGQAGELESESWHYSMDAEVDPRDIALQQLSDSSEEFPDCTLGNAYPMYNPNIKGVAYYEFEVLSQEGDIVGYVIVSTNRMDAPVPEYSDTTLPHFHRFVEQLGHKNFKMFRYGLVYVVAEDKHGNLIAEIGEMPPILVTDLDTYMGPKSIGLDFRSNKKNAKEVNTNEYPLKYYWPADYTEFKNLHSIPRKNLEVAEKRWELFLNNFGIKSLYTYRLVTGQKCYWGQIQSATCYTGCGPTAWCNLYGWWEKAQGKSNLFAGSPDPCIIDNAVSSCIWSIVSKVGTYCIGNNGATSPWDIYKGYSYASDKGYGSGYQWHWRIPGSSYWNEADILRKAGNSYRTSIIGYYDDWHYAVGYYYKFNNSNYTDVWVKVITGWGCQNTKWVHVSNMMAVVDFWIP